jgi:hypothetical protein
VPSQNITAKGEPQAGLENNTGKDGKIFSDKQPYFPSDCEHCRLQGDRIVGDLADRKIVKNCFFCTRAIKLLAETGTKIQNAAKDVFYQLPYKQQFKEVFNDKYKVFEHYFSSKKDSDYIFKLDVAKAFARQFGNCYINPIVDKRALFGRKRIFKKLAGNSNPDLTTIFGYVDVKTPKRHLNSVSNANAASSQSAIAAITTHRMKPQPTERQVKTIIENIWKEKNYLFDVVFWYDRERLMKYNRPK